MRNVDENVHVVVPERVTASQAVPDAPPELPVVTAVVFVPPSAVFENGEAMSYATVRVTIPVAAHVMVNAPPVEMTSAPKSTYPISGFVAAVPGVES
jgi:hypothetical protein